VISAQPGSTSAGPFEPFADLRRLPSVECQWPWRWPAQLESDDGAVIAAENWQPRARLERWAGTVELAADCRLPQAILGGAMHGGCRDAAGPGDYPTWTRRLGPRPPGARGPAPESSLARHTHSEDEVRFFVEGRGLFPAIWGRRCCCASADATDLIRVRPAAATGSTWAVLPLTALRSSTPRRAWCQLHRRPDRRALPRSA